MASKYEFDKFYTKEDISKYLISLVDTRRYKTIIEPSAGTGSFSNNIEGCYAIDIAPEGDGIYLQDFFTLDYSNFRKPILVIGNPPFGRNGSLALNFIKYSSLFADTIAFILPKSFKKQSFYNKIPLNFWLYETVNLPDNSFIYKGEEKNIPCVFQIYEKSTELRQKVNKTKTDLFSFTNKEKANISIRRVGVNAGRASKDLNKSPTSHYFVYKENPEDFIRLVNSIEWEHDNTVGSRSISKGELIEKIEHLLDKKY
jgi:hypothetical protein